MGSSRTTTGSEVSLAHAWHLGGYGVTSGACATSQSSTFPATSRQAPECGSACLQVRGGSGDCVDLVMYGCERSLDDIRSQPRIYRSVLNTDINADNADAVFCLAAITSISAMARTRDEAEAADNPGVMSMDSVTELFLLTRGVRDVVSVTRHWVDQGPMVALFDVQMLPQDSTVTLPPVVNDRFDRLHELLQSCGLDAEAMTHCKSALESLRMIYRTVVYFAPSGTIHSSMKSMCRTFS